MELAFWIFVALVFYTYAGYPLLLALLERKTPPSNSDARSPLPTITIIIAAYNEEKHIAAKLDLVLEMNYPENLRQIIVASDCSSDNTHEIVRRYKHRGVKLVVLAERGGKTAAQNLASEHASGEVLIFTDATTKLKSDAFRHLVAPLSNSDIGCTGAALEYRNDKTSTVASGGGVYWRYERQIKKLESAVCSLIGVSGCLYAIRRSAFEPLDPSLISDFVVAQRVYAQGLRTKYVEKAISYEDLNDDTDTEFGMRVRVIVRSINALVRNSEMLNPFRYGFFAFQILSHKVLRYLVPEFLLAIFFLSAALTFSNSPGARFYGAIVVVQLVLYLLVPAIFVLSRRAGFVNRIISALFYLLLANVAALFAQIAYLKGERAVTWATIR